MKIIRSLLVAAAILGASLTSTFAGERVYIPLGGADALVVVDPASDTVVGRIEGLPAVHGLAGTPDGRYLIAGSYDERSVGGTSPTRPEAVSEDEHAAHHAKSPAPATASDETVSTVSVVRTSDRTVVRRIDVPGAVHHVAIDPNGRVAVVTHPNEGAISAIDLATYKVVATVATGPLPSYAVFAPDGTRVYVSNAGNNTVSEVDTRTWAVRRAIPVGNSPEHVALSTDGGTLFVNNVDDGTVSVVALESGKSGRIIRAGDTPHGVDLSDDGRTLFVSALADNRLVAIDLASGAVRKVLLNPAPYHLAVIPGTGKIYVSSAEEPKIWVVDARSLAILGEIAIGGKGHQMSLAAMDEAR